MKPKQPVQRVGYFPEQPAQPQATPQRRRADKPYTTPPRSRVERARTAQPFDQRYGEGQLPAQPRGFAEQGQNRQPFSQSYGREEYPAQPSAQPRRRAQTSQPFAQSHGYEESLYAHHPHGHSEHAKVHAAPEASHKANACEQAPAGFVPHSPRSEADTRRQLLLRRILLLVCVVVFAVSAFLLVRYFVNIAITRRASAKLEEAYSAALQNTEVPTTEPMITPAPTAAKKPKATRKPSGAALTPTPTAAPKTAAELWPKKYPNNPTLRVSTVFYEMQRQNPDIVGWLKIDGVLEEAVVQRDNSYYLTHNALKQKSVTGALFLDENCDLKTVPTQMLIHGHNMKEGAMFGSLKKYKVKDASFYRQHPFIDFNTMYENGRYVIFAVAEVDLRWNKSDYLPFWQDVRFSSAEEFEKYVKKARDLSHYHCNVDVQPGDRLLTLSTCTGTDDNKRLILMARRLRDNESELELNMSILTTYDR